MNNDTNTGYNRISQPHRTLHNTNDNKIESQVQKCATSTPKVNDTNQLILNCISSSPPSTLNEMLYECKHDQCTAHSCAQCAKEKRSGNNATLTVPSTKSTATDKTYLYTKQYSANENNIAIALNQRNEMAEKSTTTRQNILININEHTTSHHTISGNNSSQLSLNVTPERTYSQLAKDTRTESWCRSEEKTCNIQAKQTLEKEPELTSKHTDYPGIPYFSDSQIDSKLEEIMGKYKTKR